MLTIPAARRLHFRGHDNIRKRLLIHLCGFNLSLLMRKYTGKETPRGWQGYTVNESLALFVLFIEWLEQNAHDIDASSAESTASDCLSPRMIAGQKLTLTTGC